MVAVRIVTDSTADLSEEHVKDCGLTVIPLNVHFGDETYKDGVDLTPEQFMVKLKSTPAIPRTSQPSAGEFLEIYRRLAADGDEVVSIHISGRLSGTIASADAARGMAEGSVTVVDSLSASQGLAMCAMVAGRAAQAGRSKDDILALVQRLIPETYIIFSVDTLEYLQKNGRIGRAQALLGSLLNVKPILILDKDGVVAPYDKVRGKSRVIPRLVSAVKERIPAGTKVRIAAIHAQAEDAAQALLEETGKHYQVQEKWVAPIGPVIGCHTGPGAIGVIIQRVADGE
ncbi:MAG: DegV family protein [Bacillota bacterium]|nr:DegV family protein [Bacillota bacterium]